MFLEDGTMLGVEKEIAEAIGKKINILLNQTKYFYTKEITNGAHLKVIVL